MLLDEIVNRLVAQNVGTVNVNLFRSSSAAIPGGPGPYLTVTETGGSASNKTHNNVATERPTAQLLVRGPYVEARAMLKRAYDALGGANGLYNLTLSGVFYVSITARQGITDLGQADGAGRPMLSFNIDVEKYPS